jgi:uncharacterized protein (DUF488 family)
MDPLYTIGYGNRKIGVFIELLMHNNINVLVDIRSRPFSRFNVAFRRKELEEHLHRAGIGYMFMGNELGGRPADPSLYVNDKVSYSRIRSSEPYRQALTRLVELSQQGQRVCIMCSELDPDHCHRKLLVGSDLENMGLPVVHIDSGGNTFTGPSGTGQQELF